VLGIHDYWLFVASGVLLNLTPGQDASTFLDAAWPKEGQGKVALFFLALMPQFIDPDSHTKVAAFVSLGLTFVATGALWCLVLALSAARLRGFLMRHPRGWRIVSQAAGGLFILLRMRLAVSRQ
jgi:threonine/homoserine/homoserine lactone efflux protein